MLNAATARPIVILMADDDEVDQMLTREALAQNGVGDQLICVSDGEELLDYLHRRGRYAGPGAAPRPTLILLDLKMPRMDGRTALRKLKSDPDLRRIPVVVLSTSDIEEDIALSYELGASSFLAKPSDFNDLVEAMRVLGRYWLDIVRLPEP